MSTLEVDGWVRESLTNLMPLANLLGPAISESPKKSGLKPKLKSKKLINSQQVAGRLNIPVASEALVRAIQSVQGGFLTAPITPSNNSDSLTSTSDKNQPSCSNPPRLLGFKQPGTKTKQRKMKLKGADWQVDMGIANLLPWLGLETSLFQHALCCCSQHMIMDVSDLWHVASDESVLKEVFPIKVIQNRVRTWYWDVKRGINTPSSMMFR